MQSSTFTVNIFRHSALSTCNKYTSQKNSHKNLNFPKFCCLFVCTLTMQCLSLLHYTYRESQSVYKTVLYKFFLTKCLTWMGWLLCSSAVLTYTKQNSILKCWRLDLGWAWWWWRVSVRCNYLNYLILAL